MDFYRDNAFRILGLPVTASKRDVVRRFEELQTFTAIGQVPNYNTDLPWLLRFDRNEETIKRALQALEHPKTRLLHILSWFWVLNDHDNQAIGALSKELTGEALFLWNAAAKQEKNIYYIKNLATLELILSIPGSEADFQHLINGIKFWTETVSSGHLTYMLANLGLNKSIKINNSEIDETIGNILNQSIKIFTNKWVAAKQLNKIGSFFTILNGSGLPQKILACIKEFYTAPLSDKIDSLCNKLTDSSDDYEQLYSEILTFFEAVKPYYEQIKQTGDLYIIESYGDRIGGLILDKAIDYGNKTTQWQKSKKLFEMAKTTIVGQFLKDRFEKNLEIVTKNIQQEKVDGNIKPIKSAPDWGGGAFGLSTALYGCANYDAESTTFDITKYFTIIGVPIFPLARFRVKKLAANRYSFFGKVPFRIFDKIHLFLGLLAIFFACFLIINSEPSSSNYPAKTYNNPSTSYNPPRNYINSNSQEIKSLGIKIDNAKSILRTRESELKLMDGSLKRYENQLQLLKNEIEEAESKAQIGEYVNKSTYNNNLKEFNNLVNQHNATLEYYKTFYAEYKSLLETTNEDIAKYNRLIGAN